MLFSLRCLKSGIIVMFEVSKIIVLISFGLVIFDIKFFKK